VEPTTEGVMDDEGVNDAPEATVPRPSKHALLGRPLLWIALVLLTAGAYYCRTNFAQRMSTVHLLTPEAMTALELLRREIDISPAAVVTTDEERALLERARDGSTTEQRATALFELARRRSTAAGPLLREVAGNSDEQRILRVTALLGLGVTGDEGAVEPLVELARRGRRRSIVEAASAGLCLLGPAGSPALDELARGGDGSIVVQQRDDVRRLYEAAAAEFQRRVRAAVIERQRFLYLFAPFVILLGTFGVGQPPLLLLVLPLSLYPFDLKMGLFIVLTLFTLAGLEQEWFVNLALASGVTLVGIEYVEQTSYAYAIQFLCVICLINLHRPLLALVFRKKSAIELLQDLTLSPQSRRMAIETFIRRGAELLPEILELEPSADHAIRLATFEALGFIDDPLARDRLVTALDESDASLRAAAVFSLGSFRDAKLLKRLTLLTKDPDIHVRLSAIKAIGRYGTKPAKIILETLLRDEHQDMREAAKAALSMQPRSE